MYLDICTDLKVTPFRYMCRYNYIARQLKMYNDSNQSNIKMALHPQRFEKDCFSNCLSSARYQVRYTDINGVARESIYSVEMKNTLSKEALSGLRTELKRYYCSKEEDTEKPFLTFDAISKYRVGIKVANTAVIEVPFLKDGFKKANMEEFGIAKALLQGYNAERSRQKNSNAAQAQRKETNQ